jgi:EAL domain-containing protein (putative c-di-GMP-specific phosphodiesterase class I)
MSVNLSARQLRDAMLLPLVRESLARGGIPASCVRLEITESVLMDDAQAALVVLRELRAIGVRLSVDDFGTGYSSLGYLKRFPVSTVKIDRSFVAGLVDNADDQAIVRAVMAMAQALALDVTAEGVETVGHRDCLRALGCESAQGWYYGRPLPADEAAAAFLARPARGPQRVARLLRREQHRGEPPRGEDVTHELARLPPPRRSTCSNECTVITRAAGSPALSRSSSA